MWGQDTPSANPKLGESEVPGENHEPANEKLKWQYFEFLRLAHGSDEATVDRIASEIHLFERTTGFRPFKEFRPEQAARFKEYLNAETGWAKITAVNCLRRMRRFFQWVSEQRGYRSLPRSSADYLKANRRDTVLARQPSQRPFPKIDQVRQVVLSMPDATEEQQRDRALMALLLMTGIRVGALISLKLRHVLLDTRSVFQDGREVRTKFGKQIHTTMLPLGDDVFGIVASWVNYLTAQKGWAADSPMFPSTRTVRGPDGLFVSAGLNSEPWQNSQSARSVVRRSLTEAGLPYFNPHSFRRSVVAHVERICRTPEEFKAVSQSLGHEDVLTTFRSYYQMRPDRQHEVISGLQLSGPRPADEQLAKVIAAELWRLQNMNAATDGRANSAESARIPTTQNAAPSDSDGNSRTH